MRIKIIIAPILLLIVCALLLIACVDYDYIYEYEVVGGNGKMYAECTDGETSPIHLIGGNSGGHNVAFVAIPDEGYKVKEWRFDGRIIENNNTNSYTIDTNDAKNIKAGISCKITVEFEPIEEEN